MDLVQVYTVLGVLLMLLAVIVYNNVAAARATRRRRAAQPDASPWLGKHVQFAGDVVGEVVAEDGGDLILRRGNATLAVPRSQVRPQGLDLGLKEFDRDAALAAGAAWQARRGAAP